MIGMATSGLLNDPSSLSIKTKMGQSDGIRSTKAFLTSVTPTRNDDLNLNFTVGDTLLASPKSSVKGGKSTRKVFGANAYLERQ